MAQLDRREFLFLSAGALVAAGCGAALTLDIPPDASFDQMLDRVHDTDVEFGGGLSNHAPMGAEALVTLGHGERVVGWVNAYAEDLVLRMAAAPLSDSERVSALDAFDKRAAWIAWYERELESVDPATLIAREWATLAPGAAATHGLLRTAHAYRSLQREDTPARRRELAHGLGYWSARHSTIPGTPGTKAQVGLDALAALGKVPLVPGSERKDGGLIIERLAVLNERQPFLAAVAAVDLDAKPIDDALTDLVSAAGNLFVAGGCRDIVLLHAITGSSATRLLLPALDAQGQRIALGYAFQAVAAMYAISAATPAALKPPADPGTVSTDTLIAQAGGANDVHSIKLVEAVVREHAIRPRPQLLLAAQRWLGC